MQMEGRIISGLSDESYVGFKGSVYIWRAVSMYSGLCWWACRLLGIAILAGSETWRDGAGTLSQLIRCVIGCAQGCGYITRSLSGTFNAVIGYMHIAMCVIRYVQCSLMCGYEVRGALLGRGSVFRHVDVGRGGYQCSYERFDVLHYFWVHSHRLGVLSAPVVGWR